MIFIDACREQVKVDRRGTETHDATPLLKSMAEAKGQVVFYGAAPGCFAYDDDQRQNGVFTAALLDGLRCSAVADEQGLITVDALADFVNQRVLAWVRSHRDRSATQGIQVTVDRGTRSMALAACAARAAGAEAPPVRPREPAAVRTEGSAFHVVDAAGITIWGHTAKGTIAHAELADLDGDGHAEVIVGVGSGGDDAGKILVYGGDGKQRWTAGTTAPFNYDSGRSGKLAVLTFTTGDLFLNGQREVVSLSLDSQGWYPSRLCVFDSGGSLVASYWHPGHLHQVVVGAETEHAAPQIIVSGVNNDLRAALHLDGYIKTVFLLDPRNVIGEAPPYLGKLRRGSELWYGVLLPATDVVERLEIVDRDQDGKNEISVWMASRNVFYLSFAGELRSIARADGATSGAEFHLLER